MRIEPIRWRPDSGWSGVDADAGLILYFGSVDAIEAAEAPAFLTRHAPRAAVLGCSTAAGILGSDIDEDGVVGVVCRFQNTTVRLVEAEVPDAGCSAGAGRDLGRALRGEGLAGALVLSDGVNVNGSAIAEGMVETLGMHVPVSGGLAADGAMFARTLVGAGGVAGTGRAAALGFYGGALRLAHASAGGWEAFGPRRRITRSHGCVLEELDGKPALALYERYLAEEAAGLPATALFFPLMVWDPDCPEETRVRTVLSIDRERGTMTFAGDIPVGWGAQLMRGNLDGLVAGAGMAGQIARDRFEKPVGADTLALLVSCVGRRLLMGQRTAEELEAVGDALGSGARRVGFYSHGEIAPRAQCGRAMLHNQTMTVTLISELS